MSSERPMSDSVCCKLDIASQSLMDATLGTKPAERTEAYCMFTTGDLLCGALVRLRTNSITPELQHGEVVEGGCLYDRQVLGQE